MKKKLDTWLKKIRIPQLHAQAVGVTVVALIVLVGVIALIKEKYASPEQLQLGNGTTVHLKVTDHDNSTSAKLLVNSLTDTTQTPRYDDSQIMEISRDTSGNIPHLFRIQGTLTYK